MDPRGHHLLKIFQHSRPGERLAFDQLVQKLRFVARRSVFGAVEKLLGVRANLISLRDQSTLFSNGPAIASCIHRSSDHQGQQNQCEHPKRARSRPPTHPELPCVFVRLTREIDIQSHLPISQTRMLTDAGASPLRNQSSNYSSHSPPRYRPALARSQL